MTRKAGRPVADRQGPMRGADNDAASAVASSQAMLRSDAAGLDGPISFAMS